MTAVERKEYNHLINLWNCTEPMTDQMYARLLELDLKAGVSVEATNTSDRKKCPPTSEPK